MDKWILAAALLCLLAASLLQRMSCFCASIQRHGGGIPEEEQPKIFSRFYRSKHVRDCEVVGIGLYLAREIIYG